MMKEYKVLTTDCKDGFVQLPEKCTVIGTVSVPDPVLGVITPMVVFMMTPEDYAVEFLGAKPPEKPEIKMESPDVKSEGGGKVG